MENDWIETTLGDFVDHQKGYIFKSKDYQNEGQLIVRVSDFTDRSIDISSCNKIDKLRADEFDSVKLNTYDVIIATVGSWPKNPASIVGKTVSVPKEAEGALLNQNAVRLRAINGMEQRFLFSLLKNKAFQSYIVSTAQGSANQASITLRDIFRYSFKLPPLLEQKAIAHILSSLDDKIELNRQMNETLEAMAQALFKSWFVDFDPVIDNALAAGNAIPDDLLDRAEQRKGIEKKDNTDIQKLFPDEFEFTEEMGWIPKGWEVKNLTEVADFQNGFAFYTTGYSESGYKVVDLANIHTDGRFIETHRDKHVSPEIHNLPKHEKHRLYKDDIVMAMTDMTQAMGILGKCGKIYESDKYILNQRIGRIRVKEGININFLLTYLNSSYQLNFLKTRVLGTVQKYVNTTHIKEMNFVVPQNEVMNRFGNIVDPQFNKMREADEVNETLAKLRDTLLPKLLSGELRIPDAAAMVEDV